MSAQKKEISINISIADRTYPLKVTTAREEEIIRQAADDINKKFNEFKQIYEGSDHQDFLAMAALYNCTKALKNQKKVVDDDQACFDRVMQMNKKIDKVLAHN